MSTNNERDTHFQGSAHFLLQEMSKCRFIDDDDTSLHYEEMQTLIAQFAYDLVVHALSNFDLAKGTIYSPEETIQVYIPDLTAWPEPPTTAE